MVSAAAAAAAKLLQSCPTLCDPIDGSPPGSSVPGFSRQLYWSGLPFPAPWWFLTMANYTVVKKLIPNEMVSRGGALGRWLGLERRALMNLITDLIKEIPGTLLPFPYKTQGICLPGSELSLDIESASTLILDSAARRTMIKIISIV